MSRKTYTLRTPNAPASWKQRMTVCGLGGGTFDSLASWTMQQASDFIDAHASDRNLDKNTFTAAQQPKAAPIMPKPINDDTLVDIILYITNATKPVMPTDIVDMFKADGHRVDVTTINNTLNKVARDNSSPLHLELKELVVSKSLIRRVNGKTPVWESAYNPNANALVKVKEVHLAPLASTGLAFDEFATTINQDFDEMANTPGQKRRAARMKATLNMAVMGTAHQVNAGFEAFNKKLDAISARLPPPKDDEPKE